MFVLRQIDPAAAAGRKRQEAAHGFDIGLIHPWKAGILQPEAQDLTLDRLRERRDIQDSERTAFIPGLFQSLPGQAFHPA